MSVEIRETVLRLMHERGETKTVCPSEVARALAGHDEKRWRLLMRPIREAVVRMTDAGEAEIRRKGRTVDPRDFKGIYRIGFPREAGPGNSSGMRPDKR